MARRNFDSSRALFDPGDEPWRCCAQAKQSGKRCENKVVAGRRVCHKHGGTNPGAPIKNGRHSGVMKRMREVYERSYTDPNLLDLRESLALMDAIVSKAIERAESLDTPEFRLRALAKYGRVRKLTREGNADEAAAELASLGELLRRGVSEDSAALALIKAVKAQADTTIDVWRVRLQKAAVINETDVSVLFMRLHDIIVEGSDTPEQATKLLAMVERKLLVPSGASLGESGDGWQEMPGPSGQNVEAPPRDVEPEGKDEPV